MSPIEYDLTDVGRSAVVRPIVRPHTDDDGRSTVPPVTADERGAFTLPVDGGPDSIAWATLCKRADGAVYFTLTAADPETLAVVQQMTAALDERSSALLATVLDSLGSASVRPAGGPTDG